MSEPAWQHHGIPERCSSPLVPDSLMRQSQQRATSASGALHKSHSQLLHESYPQPTRSGSPVPAPFRVSLQRLPVAAGKLVAEKPLGSYIAPAEPCQASTRYSTDTLRSCSTPHGQKYFPATSRSAGSSPLPAAAAANAHSTSPAVCACGVAAAWLGHQQQQAQSADAQHLTASSDTSSSSGSGSTLPSIHHRGVQQHGPQRQGAGASSVSSTVQDDGAMDQVLQDPVRYLIQQADAATAAGMAAAQHALSQAAEADHADSSMAATSSSSIGSSNAGKPGVQVFTRNHAIQLETELQVLPAGQLLAAQQQHIQAWASQQQTQWQRQLQAEASLLDCYHHQHQQQQQQQQSARHQQGSLSSELVSQQLLPWQQHISKLAQQLTQQVAYHCVQHGRTLEVLQERYAELANALFQAITCLSQHHAALSAVTQATVSVLAASRSHAADLQQQLSAQQVATQEAQQQLAALSAQHEELQVNSQETIKQLQQLVESLKEQLWQARSVMEQQAADARAAAALEAALTKRLLAEAEDEATDLRGRLAFVHAQLQAVKEQQRVEPDTDTVAVQTETEQQVPCVVAPAIEQPPEEASEEDTDTEESLDDAPDVPKAINLLDYVSRGTKRSRLWVVKVLGQITADKSVADTVADRQGMSRSSMKDFVPIWNLNRYGLQHLSDQVLGDLCASICHHAAAGLLPARWFACFCSLGPAVVPKKKQRLLGPWQIPGHGYSSAAEGSSGRASPAERSIRKALKGLGPADAEVLLGSAAAADFWVFCACQLAYPNSVIALFPEAQEALPLVRSNLVMESIKTAFRYLGDPTGQAQFVADRLDLAAVAADTAAAPAGASVGTDRGSSSRPSTSETNTSRPSTACSVVGSFGFYNAWALLDLLLAEWLARAWGRARTMARLRREVAALQPPLEQQYAAAVTAASAADSPHAQLLHKLQDAYAVLQPLLDLAAEPLSTADPAGAGAQDASDQQQHHQQQQEPQQQGRPSTDVQERPASALQQQVAAPDAAAGACNSSSQQAEAEDATTQLLQDAANSDAEGAWRTYKLLLSLIQLVLPAETNSSTAEEDAAAAAKAAAEAQAAAAAAAEHSTGQQVTRRPVTSSTAAAEVQRACSQGIVLNERLQQKLAAVGVTFAQGVSTGSGHDAPAQAAASLAQQLAQPGALASALAAAREQRLLFK